MITCVKQVKTIKGSAVSFPIQLSLS